MRIGIDATTVSRQPTGVGNYIVRLVRALSEEETPHEFTVFVTPDARAPFEGLAGIRLVPVALGGGAVRLAWEQARLPVLVRRERLDLLHSPHYTMPVRACVRSVVTFHDMTFVTHPEWHVRAKRLFFPVMMRWSAHRANHLITNSQSTRADLMRALGVPADRVTATLFGASPEYSPVPRAQVRAVCARHGLEIDRYFLYVGVLEPRKNIAGLVRAFARIAAEAHDIVLALGGKKGWMYHRIFDEVRRAGLSDRVRFLGYVTEADLPALYTGARVFTYPSYYEGFGLPVLEAMQCGTPVVTSNVSSLPEVAGDGALLVDPEDDAALACALLRLTRDERLREDLIRRALARAAQFSWRRCARQTLDVYTATA